MPRKPLKQSSRETVSRRPAPRPARANPVPRRKERPWGWIAALAAVAVAGVALIGYVATRPSATDIAGVRSYPNLPRNHVTGAVRYAQNPPAGGNHAATPLTCGVYDRPVPKENAVHSLEHGALWITYRPGLAAAQLATLTRLAKGNDHRLLSPYPGPPAPIVATAWGKQLQVNAATDTRLATFVKVYTKGPTTPESGAACRGVGTPTG